MANAASATKAPAPGPVPAHFRPFAALAAGLARIGEGTRAMEEARRLDSPGDADLAYRGVLR